MRAHTRLRAALRRRSLRCCAAGGGGERGQRTRVHTPAQRLSRKECGGGRRRTYLVNEQFNELFTADIVTAMVGFGGKGRGVGVCYCSSLGGRDQHQQARRGKRVVAALFNNESAVRALSKLNSHNKIMARGSSFLFQRVERSAYCFFQPKNKGSGRTKAEGGGGERGRGQWWMVGG